MRLWRLLAIAALLLWLSWGIQWSKVVQALASLNPHGLLLTLASVGISDLAIAYRWYYLSHFRHSFQASLEATMLAFVLNIFAPAKLGDLVKIYHIHKQEEHPIPELTAIFLLERLLDLLVLGWIALASLSFTRLLTTPLLPLIAAIAPLLLLFPQIQRILHSLAPSKLRPFIDGLFHKLQERSTLLGGLLITLALWGLYYWNNWLFFTYATPFNLTPFQIFLASTLAFVVSAIPVTPGGIGTFQAAFVFVLGQYGVSKEEALAASLILQLLYLIPAILFTLYLLVRKGSHELHLPS
ncbi:MAG: hypothetical protein C6I00_04670 [Nitratiruptor sp.]|nr:hypothetical protein [Nitratiruptor sp.]NPA84202.1 flippase-like domain-containing protein [Campylobacterota bacterium]